LINFAYIAETPLANLENPEHNKGILMKRGIILPIYGFRFQEGPSFQPASLLAIGWHQAAPGPYELHGLNRKVQQNLYVFQYTLSGRGVIRIGDQTYSLTPGKAFLIEVPGDHHYYLPSDSTDWEFIYLSIIGNEAANIWTYMTEALGAVAYIHEDSPLIFLLKSIYKQAEAKRITDGYQASALVYQFIMEMYRAVNRRQSVQAEWPFSIMQAASYIQKHYAEVEGPDDISARVRLSKYHFIRLFHRTTGMTTIQYITKIRLEKAMELLREERTTIDEIARRVGFSNGNYFIRAFRKYTGMSPGQFRSRGNDLPLDHITFD
jgi:AraC-like DNA-binding protein